MHNASVLEISENTLISKTVNGIQKPRYRFFWGFSKNLGFVLFLTVTQTTPMHIFASLIFSVLSRVVLGQNS